MLSSRPRDERLPPALKIAALMVCGVLAISERARGQSIIAIGPPSFQSLAGPSLEDQILYRMTVLGTREPGDLVQLARLIELRSIATLASIQNDLPNTVVSVALQRDAFALWNAADALDQTVWYLPADVQNLAMARSLSTQVGIAYDRLGSTLLDYPGLSPRGAFYLEGISNLLPVALSTIGAMEADLVPLAPGPPPQPQVDLVALRYLCQLLLRDLAGLMKQVSEPSAPPDERAQIVAGLSRFQQVVGGFDRVLTLQPALPEVLESFRLMLRAARGAEALLARPNLRGAWRPLRDRVNAISDALQLPRDVIPGRAAAVPALVPLAPGLLIRLDRAIEAVASGLEQPGLLEGGDPVASRLWDHARRLELKLLVFGQRVLAGETSRQLDGALREIESLDEQLVGRARLAAPLVPGTRRNEPLIFQKPDRDIKELRKLLR
jgi:hypothetical protein